MATYYFAYGADMDSQDLDDHHDRRRRPRMRFAKSTPAFLPGYKMICNIASKYRRGGIFNVIPDLPSKVHGIIYELHPGDTISITTMKEGEEAAYVLSVLQVVTKEGEKIPALVLHAKEDKKLLEPSKSYVDIVLRAARRHKLPPEWLKNLETLLATSKAE